MTIKEILDTTNALYPNTYDDKDKIKWLSTLDRQTNEEFYKKYVDGDYKDNFSGYDEYTLLDTELLISDIYAVDIYKYYLQAQIALANREIDDYSNFMALFNNSYQSYKVQYNKAHEHFQPIANWW